MLHFGMTCWLAALVLRDDSLLHGLLRLRPLVRVGMVSYGIYLLHLVVLHGVRQIGAQLGLSEADPLFLLLYWGGTYLLAEGSFRFYESRFLRLRHKPFGRLASAPYS